mgnify:FL=1
MRSINASGVQYINALSPTNVNYAGSTGASNFAGFETGQLVVIGSSAPSAAGFIVEMLRSGTSDGTFSSFGASISYNNMVIKGTRVRSWSLESSACWYMISYNNSNGGSTGATAIEVVLKDARGTPITQNGNTTVYSDVTGG